MPLQRRSRSPVISFPGFRESEPRRTQNDAEHAPSARPGCDVERGCRQWRARASLISEPASLDGLRHLRPEVHALLDAARPAVVAQLDHRVQGDFDARRVHPVVPHEVCIEDAEHGLVAHDERGLAVALQLVHEGVESGDDVEIGLAAWIAVSDFVHLAQEGLVLVTLGHLLVSQSLVLAREDLVKIPVDAVGHLHPLAVFKLDGGVLDLLRGLVGAAQGARP
mmetsp:Transcript_7714/g.22538  ORF Transcript_7714/g.22538 Transcript_7714/m.22538 type:complete len:223 (-) Transcript_7714:1206-1874(-)